MRQADVLECECECECELPETRVKLLAHLFAPNGPPVHTMFNYRRSVTSCGWLSFLTYTSVNWACDVSLAFGCTGYHDCPDQGSDGEYLVKSAI